MIERVKFLVVMGFILVIMPFGSRVKAAGSFSVSANSYQVSVGNTVTIYVKANQAYGKFSISSSDSSKLAYVSGDETWFDYPGEINGTKVYKFVAKTAGSVKINVTPTKLYSSTDDQLIKDSKSIIINTYIPRALETNNYLSSLSVGEAELAPSFDKDTDNYIVDLEPGTTSIKINAEKANKYASISGAGEVNVVEGNNDINIVVTAENGSKRTYHITAVVKEYNPINVTVEGSDYTVVRKKDELSNPDNYEETTVTIGDDIIPAFYNSVVGYTLIGLKDVTGNVKLFIYDNGDYKNYLSLSFKKMDIVVLETDKTPRGFKKDTITLDNQTITCYKNDELGIVLIYGKSLSTGEESFYSFENSDLTIQKFNIAAYNEINKKIDLYTYIIIGLGALNLLILLCLITSSIRNKKKLKHKKDELEKTISIDTKEINNKLGKKDKKKSAKEEKEKRKIEKQKEKELRKVEQTKKKVKENKKNQDNDMFYL